VLGLGRFALSPARRLGGDLEDKRLRKELQSFFDLDRLKSRMQMQYRCALASQLEIPPPRDLRWCAHEGTRACLGFWKRDDIAYGFAARQDGG